MATSEARKQTRRSTAAQMPSTTENEPVSAAYLPGGQTKKKPGKPNVRDFDRNEAARHCPGGGIRGMQESNGWYIDPLTNVGYYDKTPSL
jgi:hypothetical protein